MSAIRGLLRRPAISLLAIVYVATQVVGAVSNTGEDVVTADEHANPDAEGSEQELVLEEKRTEGRLDYMDNEGRRREVPRAGRSSLDDSLRETLWHSPFLAIACVASVVGIVFAVFLDKYLKRRQYWSRGYRKRR